ncbi:MULTISPECIES: type I secretion system permease/ATPase [unclassified Brevundimonas]|uniref:type I secretion system permease/ATPase n=1 Tax=unclassified Brevundimonas TaxID=2622653 RepID=UPI0025C37EE1|nr:MULTISPECIES: type I secretion system permease/ATPase [unclassified Brevundimonas]
MTRPLPPEVDPIREGLALLAAELGCQTTAAMLGDGLPLEDGRLPLDQIRRAMRRAGLSARVVPLALDDVPDDLYPTLVLLKNGRTLVFAGREGDNAIVLSPFTDGGAHLVSMERLRSAYTGQMVFARPVYRSDDRAGAYAKPQKRHWLRGTVAAAWPSFIEVGTAAIFANLLAVGTSLFAMQVYDRVVPTSNFPTLWVLASGVVIAILLELLLRQLRSHLLEATGKSLDLKLSSRLFEQVMAVRLAAKPGSTGAFVSQVKEFEGVREFFTASTVAAVSDAPFILLFIGVIAILGGPVAFAPIAAVLLMIIPAWLMQSRMASLSRENLREGAVKHGLLLETVENLEGLKAARGEGRNLRQWDMMSATLADTGLKTRNLSTALTAIGSSVQQLAYVGAVVIGVYQISAGHMTMGALVACSLLVSRAISPTNQFVGIMSRWQYIKVALEGLDHLMEAPVERPEDRSFTRKTDLKGHFKLEGVEVRFDPEAAPVLNVQRLEILPGERVALIGGNGAGKSTLLRALSGLGDITSGRLLLDEISLSQIDPADRRHAIGYLPQDAALFHGSLRDNLTLDGGRHTDEDLFDALDAVGLGVYVRAHPHGLDLPLVGRTSVSGGQRQAIGLARLILQDPRIVLMDEPTAAFDQNNENRLIGFMKGWLEGRTAVIATHRRSVLALTDRMVALSNGRIVGSGPAMGGPVQGGQVANG